MFQEADLVVLVGTNPSFEAPLVNTQIRKRYKLVCVWLYFVMSLSTTCIVMYQVLSEIASIQNFIASSCSYVHSDLKVAMIEPKVDLTYMNTR